MIRRSVIALAVASLVGVAPIQKANAGGFPVFDAVSEALMLKEIAEMAKEFAVLVQLLDTAVRTLTLQNLMRAALGEGLGGSLGMLIEAGESLYSSGNSLYWNVTNKGVELTNELNNMLPNMQNMSFQELMNWGTRWKGMMRQETLSHRELEMMGIRVQDDLRKSAAASLEQSKNAKGVTSATQAGTHMLGSIFGQLDLMNTNLALMAQNEYNKVFEEDRINQTTDAIRKRDREILDRMLASQPGRSSISPLKWGN